MLILLTILMICMMAISTTVDVIFIRWHHQDRKRMTLDETEIQGMRFQAKLDEAEIKRLSDERTQGRW